MSQISFKRGQGRLWMVTVELTLEFPACSCRDAGKRSPGMQPRQAGLPLAREDKPVSEPVGRCLAFVLLVEKRPERARGMQSSAQTSILPMQSQATGRWVLQSCPWLACPRMDGILDLLQPPEWPEVSLGERKGIRPQLCFKFPEAWVWSGFASLFLKHPAPRLT
ncbi:hypothetical protein NXF25_014852 [Crotalus adamanteus]|uniref:Uncharacterized protein n=1 Tax=Crotalus adamanteus TaxID=8729 RepID=A0AAW1AWN0_CROAD